MAKVVFFFILRNVLFVVDVEVLYVRNVKCLLADDMGVWYGIGIKIYYFREVIKVRAVIKVTEVMFGFVGVYRCTRSFYRNESDFELYRLIIYLRGWYFCYMFVYCTRIIGSLEEFYIIIVM